MASVNRLAARRLPAWITLTYPAAYPTDPAVHKGHLRSLLKRLRREYGPHAVVWRLEWQKRGAPHYHLVGWDLKVDSGFQKWLSRAWYEVVGSGDERHLRAGTNASQADSWRGLTAYLSKYMAKPSEDDDPVRLAQGRIWGVENGQMLPVEPISWLVSVREGYALRRVLKRASRRSRGSRGAFQGMSAFVSDSAIAHYVARMTKDPFAMECESGLPPVLLGLHSLPD